MANNTNAQQCWRRHIFLLALSVLATLALLDCTQKPKNDLLDGLSPGLIRHLVSSDDSTLARYFRHMGYADFREIINTVAKNEFLAWQAGREDDARKTRGYLKRLAYIFAVYRHTPKPLRDVEFRERLPRDTHDELIRARFELHLLNKDTILSARERMDAFTLLMGRLASLKDTVSVAMCQWHIAFAAAALGDQKKHRTFLRQAYEGFAALGHHSMTCQALGVLGVHHERAGQIDSMIVCYEEAWRIANRSRMGNQAARILSFYGGHYRRQGRLDLERLLHLRAVEVARAYNAGYREIRFVYQAMRFHADLECWDVVEKLLPQAQGIKRRGANRDLGIFEINYLRSDAIGARLKMARGDVTGAKKMFDRVLQRISELNLPYEYRGEDDSMYVYRSRGFLENGHPADALADTRQALSRPPDETTPFWSAHLALLMAKAAFELDDNSTAESALEDFDRFSVGVEHSLRRELTERDALYGRIALSRGNTTSAAAALMAGLARLEQIATTIDASVGSYIWLAGCRDLRNLMHELTSDDPLAGYGAELYWRGLFAQLGAEHRGGRTSRVSSVSVSLTNSATGGLSSDFENFIPVLRSNGERNRVRTAALDAVHCVYLVRNGNIWRWTASRSGIRRETLSADAKIVRGLVTRTVKMMSNHPRERDSVPSTELRKTLQKLAKVLLPGEMCRVNAADTFDVSTFFVTTDGFLGQIPFEALDVGNGDAYNPLLADRDVAYIRSPTVRKPRTATGPGVILVNAGATGVREHFVSQPSLRYVEPEGKTVFLIDSTAKYLSGDAATKPRLTSLWEDSPFVYMATHTIYDPEAPYLVMIPLAASHDNPAPDAAYLDISDIRLADLGGCEIVVLSSCSSGTPYVQHNTFGPGLGDAFLDAGAGAVVHTFWNVKDEDARRIGTRFVGSWKRDGTPAVRALSDVRREEMRGPEGIRHPSYWAAYAIKLSRF